MPDDYFKDISLVQVKEGLKNIKKLPEILQKRKETALIYNDFLKRHGKRYVEEEYISNHSFLRYPIWVKDKACFLNKAEKAHIQIGDWFVTPIHPIENNLAAWHCTFSNYPTAQYVCNHVLNLPTTPKNLDKVLKFLDKNIDLVI